jgi:serine protease AprX
MVSGIAALMVGREYALTPDTIKARLMKTASKSLPLYSTAVDAGNATYTIQYDMFTIGAGYVDVWAALNNSDALPPGSSAASPTAVFDPGSNTVTVLNTTSPAWDSGVWGTNSTWDMAAVWSPNVFAGPGVLWGSGAVWGTSGTGGNDAIWSSSPIWVAIDPGPGTNTVLLTGEN